MKKELTHPFAIYKMDARLLTANDIRTARQSTQYGVIPNPALFAGFGICFLFSDPQSLCAPAPPRLN